MLESMKSRRFRVQSPFLQNLRGRFGKVAFRLLEQLGVIRYEINQQGSPPQ